MTTQPDSYRSRLGAQLWLEEHDDATRVETLIRTASEAGLSDLRVFLMWNWMQPNENGPIDFDLYDHVFAAAERFNVKIKATLTANSGPWWTGAPGVLHTFTVTLDPRMRPAMARYIHESVERYASHPALGQWILWNEPINPLSGKDGPPVRTPEAHETWSRLLQDKYRDVEALNERWRTGFQTWDEIPFPEGVTVLAHNRSAWRTFAPRLMEYRLRETVLRDELDWIAREVRKHDSTTPLCINPPGIFHNQADAGYDFTKLATITEVLGASFHAPWSFTYAPRRTHLGLIAAGVSFLRSIPGPHSVEVTEMQIGNTYYAGERPIGVDRGQVAASYLVSMFAGAESSTGWCLNTRSQDFEAGEWGLFADDDYIGDRARGVQDAAAILKQVESRIGEWKADESDVLVVVDEESQAIEIQMAMVEDPATGRGSTTSIQGNSLIVVELLTMGVSAAVAPASAIFEDVSAKVILVSHQIAWSARFGQRLFELVERGITVVVDGTSGQFDSDAVLWRPGPGQLANRIGARSLGLESALDGSGQFALQMHGFPVPDAASVRSSFVVEDLAWAPFAGITFSDDDSPAIWSRRLGQGQLIYSRLSLAAAALRPESGRRALRAVLDILIQEADPREVIPRTPDTLTFELVGRLGRGWAVVLSGINVPVASAVRLSVEPGTWSEIVTGRNYIVGADRELVATVEGRCGVFVRD